MILGKPREKSDLEKEIARVTATLSDLDPGTKEYATVHKQLKGLHALKVAEQPKPVDPNTLLNIGGSILGILIIVGYEQKHVVTSKAVGFLRTLR